MSVILHDICCQKFNFFLKSISLILGYINVGYGNKAGYYFSSTLIIFGSMTIFLIDVHRRHAAKSRNKQK